MKAKNQTLFLKREIQQANYSNSRNTKSFSSITVGIRKLREKRFTPHSPFPWNSSEVSNLGAFIVNPASFGVTSGTAATAGTSLEPSYPLQYPLLILSLLFTVLPEIWSLNHAQFSRCGLTKLFVRAIMTSLYLRSILLFIHPMICTLAKHREDSKFISCVTPSSFS